MLMVLLRDIKKIKEIGKASEGWEQVIIVLNTVVGNGLNEQWHGNSISAVSSILFRSLTLIPLRIVSLKF